MTEEVTIKTVFACKICNDDICRKCGFKSFNNFDNHRRYCCSGYYCHKCFILHVREKQHKCISCSKFCYSMLLIEGSIYCDTCSSNAVSKSFVCCNEIGIGRDVVNCSNCDVLVHSRDYCAFIFETKIWCAICIKMRGDHKIKCGYVDFGKLVQKRCGEEIDVLNLVKCHGCYIEQSLNKQYFCQKHMTKCDVCPKISCLNCFTYKRCKVCNFQKCGSVSNLTCNICMATVDHLNVGYIATKSCKSKVVNMCCKCIKAPVSVKSHSKPHRECTLCDLTYCLDDSSLCGNCKRNSHVVYDAKIIGKCHLCSEVTYNMKLCCNCKYNDVKLVEKFGEYIVGVGDDVLQLIVDYVRIINDDNKIVVCRNKEAMCYICLKYVCKDHIKNKYGGISSNLGKRVMCITCDDVVSDFSDIGGLMSGEFIDID